MQNSPHLGNLFVISGPSGVGKDTLVARIFNDNKILNQVKLQKSTSVTSRKPRKGEIEGRDYFFRSKENIKNMIKNNELLEWNEYAGNIYGTPKFFIEQQLSKCKNTLLCIDVNGAMNVKRYYQNSKLIFILPPSFKILRNRLQKRGTDNPDQIEKRLDIVKSELRFKDKFDKIVVNDKLDIASKEVVDFIYKSCKITNSCK